MWIPRTLLVLTLIVLAGLLVHIHFQRQTINALIELNHDKNVYIDAGCHGRYQGAEELLPGERGPDDQEDIRDVQK